MLSLISRYTDLMHVGASLNCQRDVMPLLALHALQHVTAIAAPTLRNRM